MAAVMSSESDRISDFLTAAAAGDIARVQRFISQGMDVNVTDKQAGSGYKIKQVGDSALHKAAECGHIQILEALCAARPPLAINKVNQKHQTALHKASIGNQSRSVEFLLKHGADHWCKTKLGLRPIHIACSRGFIEVVKVLCEAKTDIQATTTEGETPLLLACISHHTDIVKYLLPAVKSSINQQDLGGRTALHMAVSHKDKTVVSLLREHGANQRIKNKKGESALDLAERLEDGEILDLLQSSSSEPATPEQDFTDACLIPGTQLVTVDRRNIEAVCSTIEKRASKVEEIIGGSTEQPNQGQVVGKKLKTIHEDLEKVKDVIFTEERTSDGETVNWAKMYKKLVEMVYKLEEKIQHCSKSNSLLREPKCTFLNGHDEIFIQDMCVEEVIHMITQEGLLDYREKERVEALRTRHEKVMGLLNVLSKKTDIKRVKEGLIKGLENARQEHLAVLLQDQD